MAEVSYEDFSLWIEPRLEGQGYCVTARCRAGEGSACFELPAEMGCLSGALADLAARRKAKGVGSLSTTRHLEVIDSLPHRPPLKAREVGDLLFRALFSGQVRQLYDRVSGMSGGPRCGVRIKLYFDPRRAAELCNLPWELIYAVDTKDYLGLDRLSPVVRYLELARPNAAVPFAPPLRVLLAAANPPGSDPLNLEAEARLIRQSLASPSTEITVLPRVHLEELREMLVRGAFHVLHFMGHGLFDEQTGVGSLLLASAEGDDETVVSGEVVAEHLKGCLPQLVVVNACDSGRAASDGGHDFFAGVASSLVMAGVPAVVAMRTPITDRAAIAFSKALYRDLAAGAPVDAAVAEGRLAIYRLDSFSFEWVTPVLFLRVPDGRLFAASKARDEALPSPGRRFEIEDELRIGADSDLRGKNVDIGIQRGPSPSEPSRSSIQIDGRVTADGNLTIVNRKSG